MILRPFLSNYPLTLVLIVPIIIVFQVLNIVYPFHTNFENIDLGLWGKTAIFTTNWSYIISSIIIFFNAFQINYLFNKHEFLDRNNYTPSLFYVVLMSFSHSFYQPDSILFSHVLLIQVIRILFRLKGDEEDKQLMFNAAFLIGICATLLPTSSGFLGVLWISAWALQAYSIRTWFITWLGFLTPIMNGLIFWWLSGHRISTRILKHAGIIQYETEIYVITSITIFCLFLLSLIGIQIRTKISNIRFKRLNRSLVWVLIGALMFGSFELIYYKQGEWMSFVFIPLCIFFSYAFIHKLWRKVATVFFYLALLNALLKFFLISYIKV